MDHLRIDLSIEIGGDTITALGDALEVAKAVKRILHFKLHCKKTIIVQPTSNLQDLITIAGLEERLAKLEQPPKP